MVCAQDWFLSDFDFVLPEGLIATHPACPRDSARLLHVARNALEDLCVRDLAALLREGDLLVVNDTKVVPARLFGLRDEIKVEVLLNKPQADDPCLWSVLARPGKRLKEGQTLAFAPDFVAEVAAKKEHGEILLRFAVPPDALFELLEKHGHVPLPPYIKRPDEAPDHADYQTVYAARKGAVAAPTAGLHFTPELLARLEARGIERQTVTLHVGAGTFLPVKTERVADHKMHAEWGEITPSTAARIADARREGRRIVAVGTTALRLLESAADEDGRLRPFSGETDIFITPGYRFKAVDALMTNFHLPKSTLFMLVCAFAGMKTMKSAYAHAIAQGYRFYSYGDATFLERAED